MIRQHIQSTHGRGYAAALSVLAMLASTFYPSGSRAIAQPIPDNDSIKILEQASKAFTRVAREATPAVVFIRMEMTVEAPARPGMPPGGPFDFFGEEFFRRFFGESPGSGDEQRRQQRQIGHGSGFIVSPDGYILTSNHLVEGAQKIMVRLHDGREFEATKVGGDPQSEVAVIKIEAGDDLPAVRMGDSDALQTGEWVIAIGNPFGLSASLTVGVVSAKGRTGIGLADYEDFIQTDAAINPGNSGGPLLDIHGRVIGINTAIFTRHGGYMGIGFAVPINMARAIKRQLIETGEVIRGHLGVMIQEMTSELAASFGMDEPRGVLVGAVVENSPADRHGIQEGDILLALNGDLILNVASFRNHIAMIAPGSMIDLTVFRDGEELKIEVEIGTHDPEMVAEAPTVEQWSEKLGFVVTAVTEEASQRFGYEPGSGVLVSQVTPFRPAARAGIRPGHLIAGIDRQPVSTPEEFYRHLNEAEDTVLLQVREGQSRSRFVALRLPR